MGLGSRRSIAIAKNREDVLEVQGEITESLRGGVFRIKLENRCEILGHLSGKMRKYHIKCVPGDIVTVELSIYDVTKGRITYRNR